MAPWIQPLYGMYDRCKQSIINMLRKHIFEHRLLLNVKLQRRYCKCISDINYCHWYTNQETIGWSNVVWTFKNNKNITCIQISSLFWQPRRKFQTYCTRAPWFLSAFSSRANINGNIWQLDLSALPTRIKSTTWSRASRRIGVNFHWIIFSFCKNTVEIVWPALLESGGR